MREAGGFAAGDDEVVEDLDVDELESFSLWKGRHNEKEAAPQGFSPGNRVDPTSHYFQATKSRASRVSWGFFSSAAVRSDEWCGPPVRVLAALFRCSLVRSGLSCQG